MSEVTPSADDLDIAVIGMAGRFPGARNVEEYWRNLRDGVESVTTLSDDTLLAEGVDPQVLRDPRYVKAASVLDGVEMFDAGFFGFSPKEAELMDPQARLFLECAWEALEGAGYPPQSCSGSVGVYATESLSTYLLRNVHGGMDFRTFVLAGGNLPSIIANGGDFLSTRVSYKLNLRGPSFTVQSACSSSLVAIHLARQALLAGECDVALAGGVSIYLPQKVGYLYDEGMILSSDGHCRPFDAAASGTVFGRGVGVVVLKPLASALADGDRVRAVLKGSAINNDGALKVGYSAPSVKAQAEVIAEAIGNAGVDAETIRYVEAHGTGTRQGDPIEITALTQAFRTGTQRRGFCAIGAAKSNLGHLDVAAGVAGFIKAVLTLEHGLIPPSLNFETPNPQIDFAGSPFFVNTALTPWPADARPRRAGVSSFGMGGTNAHVVLEQAPAVDRPALPRRAHVLTASARDDAALRALAGRWAEHLRSEPEAELGDVCFTANTARSGWPHRAAWVVDTAEQAADALAAYGAGRAVAGTVEGRTSRRPTVAFLFPGQGSPYVAMGSGLYETEPAFRAALEECEQALGADVSPGVRALLRGRSGDLAGTAEAQPALFALEYALAALWQAWGLTPAWVLGHSLGEYAAACVAGALDLPEAIRLVAARGRLMHDRAAGGDMVAVFAPVARVAAAVAGRAQLSVAAVNGPEEVVIAGAETALVAVVAELARAGIRARSLATGYAFHSPLMDAVLDPLEQEAQGVKSRVPRISWMSTVTAEPVTEPVTAEYWRRQASATVQYGLAVDALRARGCDAFVEVGPGVTLTTLGLRGKSGEDELWAPSLRAGRNEPRQMLETAAALYARGVDLAWGPLGGGGQRRVTLPTYPFQRKRYWAVPSLATSAPAEASDDRNGAAGGHPLLGDRLHSPALSGIAFESRLGLGRVPFLRDHRVFGSAVLPATAYLEIAGAAATAILDGPAFDVEDVTIVEALRIADAGQRVVQLLVESPGPREAAFRLLSRDAGPGGADVTWTLHATGRIVRAEAVESPDVRLPDVGGLTEIGVASQYERFATMGLDYGPCFRGLARVWARDGEALGELELPDVLATDASAYRLHPALLDACLHVAVIALGEAEPAARRVYLPLWIGSFRWLRKPTERLRAHATVRREGRDGGSVSADVRIVDDGGALVAEAIDLRLRAVTEAAFRQAADASQGPLYELSWVAEGVEAELTAEPGRSAMADHLRPELAALALRHGLDRYRQLIPRLDALALSYIVRAFADLGWRPLPGARVTTESVADSLGIVPQQRRLLGRLLEILAEEGQLAADGDGWIVRAPLRADDGAPIPQALTGELPACALQIDLTARCGESLAAVLRGTCDPLQLLFPGGSFDSLERFYQESPFTLFNNTVVRDLITEAVARFPRHRPLRVLEIGGGTASTTTWVLPVCPPDRTEYVFTDVSPAFTSRARRKFGRYPFVRYEVLNIEASPSTQGFDGRRFDIVLAANVLHATRDMRETLGHVRDLLADDGLVVMLEGTGPQRWVDLTFGMTDGWWRFTDTDLRPSYPLLSRARWLSLLGELGFVDATAIPEPERGEGDGWQTAVFARAPRAEACEAAAGETWLILGDETGPAGDIAARVRSGGDRAIVVRPGVGCDVEGDVWQSDPAEPEHARRVIAELVARGLPPLRHVVDLGALVAPPGDTMSLAELRDYERRVCGSLLHLVQALASASVADAPRLWVVTRGAQPLEPGELSVAQATLWGAARVVALEHPELRCTCVDLAPSASPDDGLRVHAVVARGDREDRLGFRRGRRYVERLLRHSGARGGASLETIDPAAPVHLDIAERGTLDGLVFRSGERRVPEPGEVEIEVRATGLNFKDVLNALGMYPGDAGPLGNECSGTVVAVGDGVTTVRVGDEVVALAPRTFARHVTTRAELVVGKPPAVGFEEAATLPVAFVTAHYALSHVVRLAPGDTVLIHSAAGGVGLAALQVARLRGAEVFATAGTPEKRGYLQSLGVRHVMDSRSAAFATAVMEATGGRGVDVVLNSLAGELASASLGVLAPGGRFLEIGKAAVLTEREQATLGGGRRYFAIDVGETARDEPALVGAMLAELMAEVAAGRLSPLPLRTFALSDVSAAFRYMARGRHIGKIVVVVHPAGSRGTVQFRPDASYLLTGGLGGLGLLVARWMVERGARHLVLVGRRPPSDGARESIAALEKRGAHIAVVQGDVSREADIERILAAIAAAGPPLRGILHGAGALDDGVIVQQTWERFATVFEAKVDGAWLLHDRTHTLPLDFFVLFSSIASMLGSAGQMNHAGANAFMDALAHHRRAAGLPALSINWGPWAEVGAAADRNVIARLRSQGIAPISPPAGLEALERLMLEAAVQVGVVNVDWPKYVEHLPSVPPMLVDLARVAPIRDAAAAVRDEAPAASEPDLRERLARLPAGNRKEPLLAAIREQVARGLGLDAAEPLDDRQPLSELGLDSLLAVELRTLIARRLGLERGLPATTLFDYPTIDALTDYLLVDVLRLGTVVEIPAAEARAGDEALSTAAVAAMSDEEAELLLLKELDAGRDGTTR